MANLSKWTIRGDDERDAVEALITNTGLSREDFAGECGVSTSTIKRLLDGEPKTDASMKALFGYLSFQKSSKLSPSEIKLVTATIRLYCEEERKPAEGLKEKSMKTMPGASPPLAVISVYVKFLHLRDRRQAAPVYRKFIPRLNETVDVFDEFVIVRTLLFHEKPKPFEMVGHTNGITDLQPAYPPRAALNRLYIGKHDAPDSVGHFETQPEQLAQGAFTIVNGFQYGNTVIGSLVMENCARLVLVVDMSSLPVAGMKFVDGSPLGFHIRQTPQGEERLAMRVEKSAAGAFILDSNEACESTNGEQGWNPERHKPLENDRYELRFSIKWDALD